VAESGLQRGDPIRGSRPPLIRRHGPFRLYVVALALASGTLAADQMTKALVESKLSDGRTVELLGGHVRLVYARNTGAAFSLLQSGGWFFAAIAVLVCAGILMYLRSTKDASLVTVVGLGLILGGAIGNLTDRIRHGFVVDFIDLRWWPVFNLADSAIVVGVAILILRSSLRTHKT
jgi:signal peptidase II